VVRKLAMVRIRVAQCAAMTRRWQQQRPRVRMARMHLVARHCHCHRRRQRSRSRWRCDLVASNDQRAASPRHTPHVGMRTSTACGINVTLTLLLLAIVMMMIDSRLVCIGISNLTMHCGSGGSQGASGRRQWRRGQQMRHVQT
jgi:hypothetical protein